MNIEYKETKNFTEKEIEELFLSVKWLSGKYPSRLIKALKSSSFFVTAWDGDWSSVVCSSDLYKGNLYIFLLLVHPDYQGNGIAAHLLDTIKEKYKDYLYINIMPDERQNITFYQKHGFTLLEDGAAMQIRHL